MLAGGALATEPSSGKFVMRVARSANMSIISIGRAYGRPSTFSRSDGRLGKEITQHSGALLQVDLTVDGYKARKQGLFAIRAGKGYLV